jgi:hypothetical protein
MGICRIEVNLMDGRGWRQWGCGEEVEPALADRLIDFLGPDEARKKLEAAGLAVPSKLFRKVPAGSVTTAEGAA